MRLDVLATLKVKLGALVAASVLAAALLGMAGRSAGVPPIVALPVAVALALGVTQLLAAGMVAPLRQMTEVAQRMARGDYSGRVHTTATDEVGRLAAAFNRMAEDLATVDRERRDLIATVSHELRTPLTGMTALLENLADGVVPADGAHLQEALDQAERLRELVTDLLELSRLEAGVATLRVAPVDLRELVAQCAEQVSATGPVVRLELAVPAGLTVDADPARLRQLLVNVLDNAARHSPPDIPVAVGAGADGDGWWLEVADRGPGVDVADRERVFERFGTDAAGGGTGLGLAVARWVAQLHGGTLRFVDPPSGAGAVLRLEVPRAPRPVLPQPEEAPVSSVPAPAAPAPSYAAGGGGGLDALFGRWWPESRTGSGLRTVVAAAVVGLLAGGVMAFHGPGLGWFVVFVTAGGAALLTARRRDAWAWTCSALALLCVTPLVLRDAPWLSALGILSAAALFLSGATGARTASGILLTGLSWPLSSLRGLPWFGRSLRVAGTGGRTPALVRTVVWSVLGLAVFGAIFASADAVFSSWVDALVPSLTFGNLVARGFVACFVFGLTLAAAYLALNPPQVDALGDRTPAPLANRFEWLVPVLVVDAVFVAFLVAQAAAVFGGHGYVERTTGLTYADYVHQGFGQLTVATLLTFGVVWATARRAGTTPTDRRWLLGSLGLLCVLTLVVVGSALHRMGLYQEAYGFTTLRVVVDVFEGWLGFVVLAVAALGATGRARWLPRTALLSGAVVLLGLVAVNPDGWVAGHNIDRWQSTGKLDADYLQSLPADAAPVIADRLPADMSRCVLALLPLNQVDEARHGGLWSWNLGRTRAEHAIAGLDLPTQPRDLDAGCRGFWRRYHG